MCDGDHSRGLSRASAQMVATIRAIARGQTLKDRVAKSRKGQEILRVLAPVPMLNCGHCQGVNTNHHMEICIENQSSRMPEAWFAKGPLAGSRCEYECLYNRSGQKSVGYTLVHLHQWPASDDWA